MTTPESPAPDFNQLMDDIQSGKVGLSSEATVETGSSDAEVSTETSAEPLESSNDNSSVKDFKKFIEDEDDSSTEESEELSESEDSEPTKVGEDIEEITVSDAKGRRKIKVDFSDREKLKKYAQLAHGGYKWKAERDNARTELTKSQEEYQSLKSDWDKLEDAYKSSGVAGIINLLEGKEDAFDTWYEQEAKKREAFNSMTDYEKREYYLEQEKAQRDSENQKLKQEYEQKLAQIEKEREATETRALESKLHPSFDRYRFSGKLGDEVAEHHYDQALWNQALSNLEELPENIEITQAIIDKEFRRVASAFRKVISKQVQDNTKKAVAKQKKVATSRAQATVSRGLKQNSDLDNLKTNMKAGNFAESLKNFFQAGGKF